ncbi:hypothetical protein J421_3792 [Gemmatirosa kalamazoonensis]|uniref:Secreted protein n=1 Tax=Gemmatirosa kalamazoonensis TaxID=861299 RepID=W0RJS4_9BACT|nr:hypothetical protein [Gemmatirosa kalamazoonensis]AHG91329.1 hypothetical protein J421_3792 [Gemmatirosa kalamazoonensis]
MSVRAALGTALRRAARAAAIAGAALSLSAHVGTNDAFYDGPAGPYGVRVAVRMPGVIPGQAQITVRVTSGEARRVLVQVAQWQVGRKGAPTPDVAEPVAGAAGTFAAPLWLMTGGAYAVNVTVEGMRGVGAVTVPVNAYATSRLRLGSGLGWILVALGGALIVGLLSLVGAAVRESVVPPGEAPDARRRRTGRVGVAVAAGIVALALVGGNTWWNAVDRRYLRGMFRPLATRGELRAPTTPGGPATLRIVVTDSLLFSARSTPIMPDHGKLMHAFVVADPSHDLLLHLHPTRVDSATFESALPDLPAGRYTVFSDIVLESGFAITLVTPIVVPARDQTLVVAAGGASVGDDAWFVGRADGPVAPLGDGFTVRREDPPTARVGVETALRFTVRDSAGRVASLAPYMGMAAHAIVLRADDSVFVHLHPMGTISLAAQQRILRREAGDTVLHGADQPDAPHALHDADVSYPGTLSFPFAFPKPGRYRIWVQSRPNGGVRTAVFDVDAK